MIESWRNTEKVITFNWAIEKQALKKDDERTEEFNYNWVFNDTSNVKQKQGFKSSRFEMWLSRFGQITSVILTIAVMIVYILIDNNLSSSKEKFDDEVSADPSKYSRLQQDNKIFNLTVLAYLNSFAYSFILICLNLANGILSKKINDKENHQMQSSYENSMI